MKNNILSFSIYLIIVVSHFVIWEFTENKDFDFLINYYIYLSVFFLAVLFLINVFNYLIPQYLGFAILGIYFIIFMLAFIVKSKLHLAQIPYFRLHFIIPILISLCIITYNGIQFLKDDKKQEQ